MKYKTMRLSLFSHVITVQNINEKTVANISDWFFLTKRKKDTLDAYLKWQRSDLSECGIDLHRKLLTEFAAYRQGQGKP